MLVGPQAHFAQAAALQAAHKALAVSQHSRRAIAVQMLIEEEVEGIGASLRGSGVPQVLEFETAEGGVMVKLMNDYAQQLLRELLEEEKVEIVREAARGEAVGARPPGV
jgi:hypothetical protein